MENNSGRKKRKPSKSYSTNRENNRETLKTCGTFLIFHTLMTFQSNPGTLSVYIDEMLHSIFFLGYIYKESRQCLTPEDFFEFGALYEYMKDMFPEPFKKYNSHLPTRTPFSILLEMMVILHSTEDRIKKELACLLKQMKFPNPLHRPGSKYEEYYTLESTVICVCYSDSDSNKYYGASLCCRKGNAKPILINVSCLKTWHEYVSHAVMSFSLRGTGDSITFPESLKCQAYVRDWKENVYKEKKSCLNCKQMFNLQNADPDKVEFPYGNCAETECLSKLLINNQYMHNNAVINNHTDEEMESLRDKTKTVLRAQLKMVNFRLDDDNFYKPSQVQIKWQESDIAALFTSLHYAIQAAMTTN